MNTCTDPRAGARPGARLDAFAGTRLNADLCALLDASHRLIERGERLLAADHAAELSAALGAAGLDPEPTYRERVDLHMARESVAAVTATLRLTYEVLATIARPDITVADPGR